MMEKNELSATVRAEVVALIYGRMGDPNILESNGGAYWRSKARASPSAHGLQRLRRDRARGRLVAQLMPDAHSDPEDRIDNNLAESFPASDPPSWTLGVKSNATAIDTSATSSAHSRF
jgi:hypothetical protein